MTTIRGDADGYPDDAGGSAVEGSADAPQPRYRACPLALWLLLLAGGQAAAFAVLYRVFVLTPTGQRMESLALAGNVTGYRRIEDTVSLVLDVISIAVVAGAIAVVGFIAVVRRRVLLGLVAATVVAGSNVTTQVLKHQVLGRPDYLDVWTRPDDPSLPSGHTTVAMSIAVAVVLVLPPRRRALAAIPAAMYAAMVGIATLSAGWHRPSDVVAAYLVVGIWAAACGLALLAYRPRRRGSGPPPLITTTALTFGGLLLVTVGVITLWWTYDGAWVPIMEQGRRQLFASYAGAAAGMAGSAALVLATVLGGLHVVLPGKSRP